MTSFDDDVSSALRALHNFGNTVMLHLSGRHEQKDAIAKAVEAWDALKKDLGQAMANNRNAMSIRQTKYHPGGVTWVDTTLVQFMAALNSVIYDTSFQDEEVKQMVRKDGVKAAGMIQEVLMDEQMLKRPLAMSMGLVSEVAEGRVVEKETQALTCPYGCTARFGTVKTLKAHMQKFHPSPDVQKRKPKAKSGRPQDKRITCPMCRPGKTTIVLHRIKEHLQKVHHRGPYTKDMKFMGFEMSSPGHYEPRFAFAPGSSGSLAPPEQVKTFLSMSSDPSGEDMFRLSMSERGYTSENTGDKSDGSPLTSDAEPGDNAGNKSGESPLISDVEPFPAEPEPADTLKRAGDKSPESPLVSHVEPFPVAVGTSTPRDEIYEPQDKPVGRQTGARRKLKLANVGRGKKARKVENISDYEEGDTDLFTERRRRAKNLRYARRTEVEEHTLPLHEMEGNRRMVENYDSGRVHSGNAKIHKYTRYLFVADDSWLVYKTRLMEGDFYLSQLVDWTGRLMQPGEVDGWLSAVPDTPILGSKRYGKGYLFTSFRLDYDFQDRDGEGLRHFFGIFERQGSTQNAGGCGHQPGGDDTPVPYQHAGDH